LKTGKLRKSGEFSLVFDQGNKLTSRALVLYYMPSGQSQARVGFCAGKRLGNAVRRNRIKRLLRESWRELASEVKTPADLVFVAREAGVQLSLTEWATLMGGLLARAGLRQGGQSN
jgi:ribonuclease P protein component